MFRLLFVATVMLTSLAGCIQTGSKQKISEDDLSGLNQNDTIPFRTNLNDPSKGYIILYALLQDGDNTQILEYTGLTFYTVKLCKVYYDDQKDLVTNTLKKIVNKDFSSFSIKFIGCKSRTFFTGKENKPVKNNNKGVLL